MHIYIHMPAHTLMYFSVLIRCEVQVGLCTVFFLYTHDGIIVRCTPPFHCQIHTLQCHMQLITASFEHCMHLARHYIFFVYAL